jgi:peptidoglycan/LPS O-acetylase OafA/YrhL
LLLIESSDQNTEGAMSLKREGTASIPALTGLRFVAALMVFVSHYPIPGVGGAFSRMTDSGYIGVTFFFILSGFVLAYNYLDAFEGRVRDNLVAYFVSRLARIYPLYFFCIMLAWVTAGVPAGLSTYLLALQAWSPSVYVAYGLDGPAWSISVELFLYACFPLVIAAFGVSGVLRKRTRLLASTGVVLLVMIALATAFAVSGRGALPMTDPTSAHRWLYRTPLTRLLDFMLGVLAAVYYLRFSTALSRHAETWSARLVYFSIAATIGTTAIRSLFASSFSFDVAYAVPFVIVILGVSINQKMALARVMSHRTLILLGESSFAFYLIHTMMRRIYPGDAGGVTPLASYGMFLGIVICTSIGLHVAIEIPCRRLIRSLFAPRRYAAATVGHAGDA